MVYGHRFDYEDPEFRTLVKDTRRRNELLFSPSVQVCLFYSQPRAEPAGFLLITCVLADVQHVSMVT